MTEPMLFTGFPSAPSFVEAVTMTTSGLILGELFLFWILGGRETQGFAGVGGNPSIFTGYFIRVHRHLTH